MGKKRSKYVSQKLLDSFYEKVANDIENNIQDKGVWAKAFAKADGDENKAKAVYIEFMVEEMILEQEMHQEEEKRKNLEEKKRIREQKIESSEMSYFEMFLWYIGFSIVGGGLLFLIDKFIFELPF